MTDLRSKYNFPLVPGSANSCRCGGTSGTGSGELKMLAVKLIALSTPSVEYSILSSCLERDPGLLGVRIKQREVVITGMTPTPFLHLDRLLSLSPHIFSSEELTPFRFAVVGIPRFQNEDFRFTLFEYRDNLVVDWELAVCLQSQNTYGFLKNRQHGAA